MLDVIAAELALQRPSTEYAGLLQRKERFEKLGTAAISVTAMIGLAAFLSKILGLDIFGPGLPLWIGFITFAVFGLFAVFFFNYPKIFMEFEKVNPRLSPSKPANETTQLPTNKLLNDPPFEPASVTEHSTELLPLSRDERT
ncbi:MAG: hypothetical protein IT174_16025 [Acidobacteria bacterium]|nr:hypothetical protein [Acidobacteriota bacterium]